MALTSVVHKVSDAFKTTTMAPTLSEDEICDSLHFASIPEVSVEPGMVLAPSIPVPYYELAKANFYMPLTMFTDDNLRWVMTQANKGQLGWDIILDFDIHMHNRYRTEHVQFSGLLWDSELKSIV